jgi:hypothetical protein
MDKLLPIKFFEKRKIDEMLPEPKMPNDNPPKWLLVDDELNKRAKILSDNIFHVNKKYDEYKQEEHELPMVMATSILEEAIAKSHRDEVEKLLSSDNKSCVIGIDSIIHCEQDAQKKTDLDITNNIEERRVLSIVMSDELFENINKALNTIKEHDKLISTITKMEPYVVECDSFNPNNNMYRVRLHDYNDVNRNKLANQLFRNKCKQYGIKIDHETRYTADMFLFRVILDRIDDMHAVQKFDCVYSIEEATPIKAKVELSEAINTPDVKYPVPDTQYPLVGVLDSGIANNKYLSPWLTSFHEEYYGEDLQNKKHGSMVASVLEYSDELNGTNYFSSLGVMMMEAIVVPDLEKEDVYPEDLIDNIRDAIERHPEIKIWNMSVGLSEEVELTFSEFGMALDNIEDENNVLIIKSAGNSLSFFENGTYKKVTQMADSVRSLVVGSIAGEKGVYDYADINKPSPFTRCGPGPSYIIKPDIVAYGGNAGLFPTGEVSTTGVRVFDDSGVPTRAAGTSFATPWITRIASELDFLIEGDFDPLTIKALMIHNAEYPSGGNLDMDEKRKFMGFGMPPGTNDILYNSENEITLILRDSLQNKQYIEIFDFPFSRSLVGNDGLYHCDISMTVVYSPILRSAQRAEYCQSDIRVAFGTIEKTEIRDTSQPRIKNPLKGIGVQNFLTNSLYSSSVFKKSEDGSYGNERTLLRYNQKFYPVKKYAIRLDDMTDSNKKKYLTGNRQWFMKVEPFFRDAIMKETAKTGNVLEQEFCIVLTIKDPTGRAPVYNEITQQLIDKRFVFSDVKLRNDIREYIMIDGVENK